MDLESQYILAAEGRDVSAVALVRQKISSGHELGTKAGGLSRIPPKLCSSASLPWLKCISLRPSPGKVYLGSICGSIPLCITVPVLC